MCGSLFFGAVFVSLAFVGNCKSLDSSSEQVLFDFTSSDTVDGWTEKSDTVRTVGLSKATAAIFENSNFKRAVFFALLNLQPNGAGFAGMQTGGSYDLSQFTELQLQCRGQGAFRGWKVVLKHKDQGDTDPTYENFFAAPTDVATVCLPFSGFKPYYRGQLLNDTEALDTSQITSIGLQTYGGIYENVRQRGPLTLEVDWIKAAV